MPISPIPDRGFWDNSVPDTERDPGERDVLADAFPEGFPELDDLAARQLDDPLFDQEAPDRPPPDRRALTMDPAALPSVGRAASGTMVDDESVEAYVASAGMPARGVIVLSTGASLGCATLDLALTGGLSIFFDLCFIVICLVGAMGVRRRDLFTAGVLAPLVLGGTIAVVSVFAPETFASGGLSKVFLSGLAQHAVALVAGYGVALAVVAGRVNESRPAPAP